MKIVNDIDREWVVLKTMSIYWSSNIFLRNLLTILLMSVVRLSIKYNNSV